jgi:hypothetical protein
MVCCTYISFCQTQSFKAVTSLRECPKFMQGPGQRPNDAHLPKKRLVYRGLRLQLQLVARCPTSIPQACVTLDIVDSCARVQTSKEYAGLAQHIRRYVDIQLAWVCLYMGCNADRLDCRAHHKLLVFAPAYNGRQMRLDTVPKDYRFSSTRMLHARPF